MPENRTEPRETLSSVVRDPERRTDPDEGSGTACRKGEIPLSGRVARTLLGPILATGLLFGCSTTGVVSSGRVEIHDVQGTTHRSPLEGELVSGIEGVVTLVIRERNTSRFWIQSLRPDDDPRTSEGIGVFVQELDTTLPQVGDIVRISGRVVEFERPGSLPVTDLNDASWQVIGRAAVPEPVLLDTVEIPDRILDLDPGDPLEPNLDYIDFWESVEGMRVAVDSPTVIGPTTRFGDFVVLPAAVAADVVRSARGGVILGDGRENLNKIIIDMGGPVDPVEVTVGDELTGVLEGVVTYAFGTYRIVASSVPRVARKSPEPARVTLPDHEDRLSIATYNVLNLSVAGPPERIETVASSIAIHLGSPDVLALQEIQDDSGSEDDGTVSAERTMSRLIDAIEWAGGPRYDYRQIDPVDNRDGGAPGGNIRVAFLFRPDRVSFVDRGEVSSVVSTEVVEGPHLSRSPGRLATDVDCFVGVGSTDEAEGTRKPLAGEFMFRGETFFVLNNHLKSKRGDDSVFGPVQPPQRKTESQRACQVEAVANFARELVEAGGRVIVLGDLNEHEFRSPLSALEPAGLVNLIERVPVPERYTYNYLGNSQVLDHILVSENLADGSRVEVIHINADFPDAGRASDHDPVVATIEF